MKFNNIYYTFFAVILFFGCEKEFLEEYPTGSITPKQIADINLINPEIQGSLLLGIYENMYKAGSGGTSGHIDFGQRAMDIKTDMLSGDMVLYAKNYGWYSDISELTATEDYNNITNYGPWRYYYRIVNLSNIVIDNIGGKDSNPEDATAKASLGQALTTRAYAYFYLTQLYQNGFDANQAILPIYTSAADPNQPKSKASEVFALIEDDLTVAKGLMTDFTRESVTQADQYVASTILAFAYAAQGKWQEAADESAIVVLNSGYRVISADEAFYSGSGDFVGGFNSVDTYSNSVLWGVDLTADSGIGLISFWGQVDYYSYSYAAAGDYKVIDASLYSEIRADDVRKNQFLSSLKLPLYKFYHEDREPLGQRVVTTDLFYFRYSDMVLLHAEAQAHLGNDAASKTVLDILLSQRIVDRSYLVPLTGQDLIDEIYLQTRIEMWGEGKSYLAMKRNKASITRGSNWLDFAGETYDYDDEKLSFEIPEQEIRDNPLVNSQN
ncbi:MAG: RagB/SusD family nutrient uptake outer membrane protein [Flavobacteriaceae bacterium]|jgi:hypothetical protein|nr:RagB/SusD family nutrient uptake outer membrane protein [Flavobacteriaceae bacterium]